ncbi:MAG TPA: glycosyltransferase family 2 protein [Casimicrobiaceae bacterium]|nr:glycosyltransferase family 2 protein [Casimicrobiaceae bacterium]
MDRPALSSMQIQEATRDEAASPPARTDVAVLIPCRNEAATIARVVGDFQAALPGARIYVYDNDSNDLTSEVAAAAGAIVRREARPGKGEVLRRMFAEIEADVYVMVDGDATYDAPSVRRMLHVLTSTGCEMVTGVREERGEVAAYRRGHRLGNRLFNRLLGLLFGTQPTDMFSGYRVLSRRFVKSFPAASIGFEIETELTVHALQQRLATAEIPTPYFERPPESPSKLATYRDGTRILRATLLLFKDERPLSFFSILGVALATVGLVLGIDVVREFMRTGLVPRLPTAILASGLMILSFLAFSCGLILDSVARGRRELKRLAYLALSASRRDQQSDA